VELQEYKVLTGGLAPPSGELAIDPSGTFTSEPGAQ
jgi:hypothetical protein